MEKAQRKIRVLIFILTILAGLTSMYSPCQASDVYIIDNGDSNAELTGQWQTSTWNGGGAYYGQNYLHDQNTGKGTKSVKYRPALAAGDYAVYIRYTASSNRADSVPVDLIHGGQTASFTLNQRQGGGQWQLLGAYPFAGDGNEYLEIKTHGTNGYVIADAVAFAGVDKGSPCLDGLAAYWNMDQNGAVIPDQAGGNIGWVNGAVPAAGKVGNGLSFDGNDAVVVSDAEELRLSNALTLCAWVKEAQRNTYAKVISRRSGDYFYFLGVDHGKPYAGIGDGTSYTTSQKSFSMPSGEWHHLAAVYDNDADKLRLYYYDGVLREEMTIARDLPYKTGVSLSIGADNEGAAHFFIGLIDEVAVLNTSFCADEIHALYSKGLNSLDFCADDLCGNGVVDLGEDCDGDAGCPENCRYASCHAGKVVSYTPGLRKDGQPVIAERTNPENALGSPEGNDTINFVSLGFGGELVFGFDNEIINRNGADIKLVETSYNSPSCDSYPETVRVYASADGNNWADLGAGCQDSEFDLGDLPVANYLKLTDESDPAKFSNSDDGFDVDGVEILSCRPATSLPVEISITAEPDTINLGETSTLRWISNNADAVELGGIGPVALNGALEVSPTETATYTITAFGPGGESVAATTVTVNELNPPPTIIMSVSPPTVNAEEDVTLAWSVENAETVICEEWMESDGSWTYSLASSGTEIITLYETTTFTITATGPGGTTSKSVTVNVILPPPVINFSAYPETIIAGASCDLGWEVEYATSISIDNGIGDVEQYGYLEVSPAETTTYTLTAVGPGGTSSATAVITVEAPVIILQITCPIHGDSISGRDVMVEGIVSHPTGDETGVVVNGIPALMHEGRFIIKHRMLTEGANTIAVVATDTTGNQVMKEITVFVDFPSEYIRLDASREAGLAPLETDLYVSGSFSLTAPAEMNSSGPGPVTFLENDGDHFKVSLPETGIYYFTATATNSDNESFSDTIAVVVLNWDGMGTMLRAKWNAMTNVLGTGDTVAASQYFSSDVRESYKANFDLLKDHLPEIVAGLHDMQLVKITEDEAEYNILGDQGGETFSFYLLFVKDADGIWRIRFF